MHLVTEQFLIPCPFDWLFNSGNLIQLHDQFYCFYIFYFNIFTIYSYKGASLKVPECFKWDKWLLIENMGNLVCYAMLWYGLVGGESIRAKAVFLYQNISETRCYVHSSSSSHCQLLNYKYWLISCRTYK